jgi:hypothetical protein
MVLFAAGQGVYVALFAAANCSAGLKVLVSSVRALRYAVGVLLKLLDAIKGVLEDLDNWVLVQVDIEFNKTLQDPKSSLHLAPQ